MASAWQRINGSIRNISVDENGGREAHHLYIQSSEEGEKKAKAIRREVEEGVTWNHGIIGWHQILPTIYIYGMNHKA